MVKRVTIRDVAREAGVSIALVSFVMNRHNRRADGKEYRVNEDTVKRILEVAERLDYHPNVAASSLRSGKTRTIGVVVSDIANRFFSDIVRRIENVACESGYSVIFASTDEKADKFEHMLGVMTNKGVDGLILAPCDGGEEAVRRVAATGMPVVLLDRDVPGVEASRVLLDNLRAGEMGVRYLYGRGYRRIETVSYEMRISSLVDREMGYLRTMDELGIGRHAHIHRCIYGSAEARVTDIVRDAAERGVEAMVFPTNTLSAFALGAVKRSGVRIPDDMALLCFDDNEAFDLLEPTIARIEQPVGLMGEKSFELLRERIEGGTAVPCRDLVLDPLLVEGGSVGRMFSENEDKNTMHMKMEEISASNSVLLLGAMFDDRGGWTADQQFIDLMGSTYLLAHGLGEPVADAVTTARIPEDGEYDVFVRTRNWTRYWSDAPTPGIFELLVDGRSTGTVFGNGDSEWHWQRGPRVFLNRGEHRVALHDLKGFDARCDAVLLTRSGSVPGNSLDAYVDLRKRLLDLPSEPEDAGDFDFVVVGGGVAGMCAALAAARLGSRVALVQDRHVLGGNNSSEIRVGLGGRLNIGMYPSLGYLLNEFGPWRKGNARTADVYEDERKLAVIEAEERITLIMGYRVSGVEKSADDTISAVTATNVDTFRRIRITGRLFADCTGDAVLGVLAGARWHMGREAASEYGEESAPEKADDMTMGASLQWYCLEDERERPFPDIDWGLPIDERSVQKVRRGQWYWEVGMRDDQIADAERIRDYGMYVAYSNWSYLKNRFSQRDEYRNSYLGWVSHVAGKRESRRLLGEFVLREQDLKSGTVYPDASVSTSWYIDQHYPDPENGKLFPGMEYLSCGHLDPLGFYPIPYRCFCSKDISNMFMAGRNISVTHIALGTVRVMRTTAMMGEVVGMAASICRRHGILPREVYSDRLEELKELMRKGVGRTDVPYMQVYTLIDTTAERSEEC